MIDQTALAALAAGLHIRGNPKPPDAKYITPPVQQHTEDLQDVQDVQDVQAVERAELAALLHR
jgi:hypothetical protein